MLQESIIDQKAVCVLVLGSLTEIKCFAPDSSFISRQRNEQKIVLENGDIICSSPRLSFHIFTN